MNVVEEGLTVPDASQALRRLELEAINAVLKAFRAQGPLTVYKEVLLDHLRSSLFVPLGEFARNAERVVNNSLLTEICHCLNPSYNSYSSWAASSAPVAPEDVEYHIRRLPEDVTNFSSSSTSSSQAKEAYSTNLKFNDSRNLCKLISFPKKTFVPEKLRQVLISSESSTRLNYMNEVNIIDCPASTSNEAETVNQVDKPELSRLRKRKNYSSIFDGLESFDVFMDKEFKRTKLPIPPMPQPSHEIYNEHRNYKTSLNLPFTPTLSIGRQTRNKVLSIYKQPGVMNRLRKDADYPLQTEEDMRGVKALFFIKETLEGRKEVPETPSSSPSLSSSKSKANSPESSTSNKENVTRVFKPKIYQSACDFDKDIREAVTFMIDETEKSINSSNEVNMSDSFNGPESSLTSNDISQGEYSCLSGSSASSTINRRSEEYSPTESYPICSCDRPHSTPSSSWNLCAPE